MAAAHTCRNHSTLPIILLALETGMRRGEIINLKWEHLDRERHLLLIPETKNGHARLIPLTKAAFQILISIPSATDRVFRGRTNICVPLCPANPPAMRWRA